jgi:hypothetical protein
MVMSMSSTYVKCWEGGVPVSFLFCRTVLWVNSWMLKCLIYTAVLSFTKSCLNPDGLGTLNCTSVDAFSWLQEADRW